MLEKMTPNSKFRSQNPSSDKGGGLPAEFREAGIDENQLRSLSEYDTVIIVDDSGSMSYGNRWDEACRALSVLAPVASKYDTDGIDIYFLNNSRQSGWFSSILKPHKCKSSDNVSQIFDRYQPDGGTPLGRFLQDVTREPLEELEKKSSKGKSLKSCKKINYLVITDGQPSDNLTEVLVEIAKRLDNVVAPPSQFGIQFIQVGNDAMAKEYLERLDEQGGKNFRDIVDTAPYKPGDELTAARMVKLLMGGINRKVDQENKVNGRNPS